MNKNTPLYAWFNRDGEWRRERVARLGASLPDDMFLAVLNKWYPDAHWVHPLTGEPA